MIAKCAKADSQLVSYHHIFLKYHMLLALKCLIKSFPRAIVIPLEECY